MRNTIGRTARIAGKSFMSAFREPGEQNFVNRLAKKGKVSKGLKIAGRTARYAGQTIQGAAHPAVLGSMALSYAPMFMQGDPYASVPLENSDPNVPQPGSQQTYAQSNMMDPTAELQLAQMQKEQAYWGM